MGEYEIYLDHENNCLCFSEGVDFKKLMVVIDTTKKQKSESPVILIDLLRDMCNEKRTVNNTYDLQEYRNK